MDLIEFINDAESRHFRTAHDTGANHNALFVWNLLREYAGMERLTREDLIRRHADDKGWTYEQMDLDYKVMDRFDELCRGGMNQLEALTQASAEFNYPISVG